MRAETICLVAAPACGRQVLQRPANTEARKCWHKPGRAGGALATQRTPRRPRAIPQLNHRPLNSSTSVPCGRLINDPANGHAAEKCVQIRAAWWQHLRAGDTYSDAQRTQMPEIVGTRQAVREAHWQPSERPGDQGPIPQLNDNARAKPPSVQSEGISS